MNRSREGLGEERYGERSRDKGVAKKSSSISALVFLAGFDHTGFKINEGDPMYLYPKEMYKIDRIVLPFWGSMTTLYENPLEYPRLQ